VRFRVFMIVLLAGVLLGTPVLMLAQEASEEAPSPQGLTIHVVQRGETLFSIAMHYGTSVDDLAGLNGLTDPTRILVGQRLLVPSGDIASSIPENHTVQAGETLLSIAQAYGLEMQSLIEINGLTNPDQIYVGQVLNLLPSNEPAPPPTATPVSPLPEDAQPSFTSNIHVVQSGETLFRIATAYGLTVQDLAAANGILDPTVIYVGQTLIIPNLPESTVALDLPAPIDSLSILPLIFVEGETALVKLGTSQSSTVRASFLGRNPAVISQNNNTEHLILMGIPMFTESGVYPIELNLANADGSSTNYSFNVRIATGFYGSQNLDVSNTELTATAVQDNEIAMLTALTTAVTPERYWSGPFSLPAAAAMNSYFGTRRSYNGGPISTFHYGADFVSAPNTPVYAAAAGKVVLADALHIRGNAVVIDHGWGVYTLYAHQNSLNVSLGDMVEIGQIVGYAGSTGRVTGPHLHWEVWINGVPVNPITWTQQSFP
jgi:murein DD-endopeptidase MepM/ murein hydrolase activator NlpD